MAAVSKCSGRSGFTDYLQNRRLPVSRADVRGIPEAGVTMALVEHAPSHGIEYDPVNELIISIVLRLNHEPVVRDLGYGEHRFTGASGQVLLTPPQKSSYWRFDSTPLVLHLGVPLGQLAALADVKVDQMGSEVLRAARSLHSDPLISQMASRLWRIAASKSPSYREKFAQKFLGAMVMLLMDVESAQDAGACLTALAPWRLRKVMAAIEEGPSMPSVAELASLVGLSPKHFSRVFKSTMGQSPYQIISAMRIERAKVLMRDSCLSMTDLAHELGFSSSAHFSSRFRQLTGLSPSEWKTMFCFQEQQAGVRSV